MSLTGRTKERGAYLPIIGVIFLTVLFAAVMFLGIGNARLKSQGQLFSEAAELICSKVAGSPGPFLQRKAVEDFWAQVTSVTTAPELQGITFLGAHLIIPTMPGTGGFQFYNPTSGSQPIPTISGSTGLTFFNAIGQTCTLGCTGKPGCEADCLFFGQSRGLPGFPAGIWNDLQSAGNTVGCEFVGLVNGQRVVARTVWGQNVRGRFPRLTPSSLVYDYLNGASTSKSVVVAIAPHMTTDALDERYRFDFAVAGVPAYSNGFLDFFDPLHDFGSLVANSGFSLAPTSPVLYSKDTGLNLHVPILPAAVPAPDDRKQMLTACMNPAILMRNALTSTLLELMSRTGSLRLNTELLLVGTQERGLANIDAAPTNFTPPTRIIDLDNSGTQDLAVRQYQFPYVVYNSAVAPFPGELVAGWTNPLYNPGAPPGLPPAANQVHLSLIANQLRYCYHLYHSDIPTALGRYQSQWIENDGFEPISVYDYQSQVRPEPYRAASFSRNWDQHCPWGSSSCSPPAGSVSLGLNATELVSILGSVQRCPFAHDVGAGTNCSKPAARTILSGNGSATDDLRPDIVGLMRYIGGLDGGVQSPGLFPAAAGVRAFSAGFYRPTINRHTALVLVTHRRLSQGEVAALVALRGTNPEIFERPISIVFIPTNLADEDDSAKNDFRIAFNIPDPIGPDDPALFVLSPHNANFYAWDPGLSEAQNFRNYWNFKLVGTAENIDDNAINIFYDRIMRLEAVL